MASLPANAFLSPVSSISSVASNYQLYRVDQKITAMQQMLSELQSMQIANLALAGLGIGISVAGFAVIKSRIDKVSTKIDNLESLINARLLDPVSPLDLARRRAATAKGDALTREAAFRREIEPARQFTTAIREFQDLSETRPLLIETLIEKRLHGRDYIEQLRAEKEAPILLMSAA